MNNAAERKRKSRERRRARIRVLKIEVHIDTVEVLIELDYLAVDEVHDIDAVQSALARFINDSTEAAACDGIMLDNW